MENLLWDYFKESGQVCAYLLYKAVVGQGLDFDENTIQDQESDDKEQRKKPS
ncbi:MAG: hypothetical protein WAP98_05275 [Caldicoprobacterales bacterium]|jgi:hypothetical protein|nr:hypothetical protein [Clostridia bacterium]